MISLAITGATGFIGEVLLKHLASQGFQLRALYRPATTSSPKQTDSIQWQPGDLGDADSLRAFVAGVDVVIHCAGTVRGSSPEHFNEANVAGVSRLAEVAAELEYRIRKNGGTGPSFPFIVASGHRGALPHGVASQKKIAAGDFVVVDYGAIYAGYASDETCTFVVGEPTKKQKKIHAIVREAHDRAIAAIKPGASLKRIDGAARTYIERQGYKKYFNHGTGHGIGLAVHEPPRVSFLSDEKAIEGMVITIEPGIYLPGWGGVRIEDTVIITKKGGEIITEMNKVLTVLDS